MKELHTVLYLTQLRLPRCHNERLIADLSNEVPIISRQQLYSKVPENRWQGSIRKQKVEKPHGSTDHCTHRHSP